MIVRTPPTSELCSRPPRIALLGCGTVGSEVATRIHQNGAQLGLELVGILVRDRARARNLPSHLFTTDPDDIFEAQPDLVIELLGGLDPAAALAVRTLSAGIPMVTANKTLIAHCGPELQRIAERCSAGLAFEAAVGAGIPIMTALDQLRADRILSLRAVLNGTCNYILTRMESGLTFADALAEAQDRGFAESDPSADISGRDSAEKLCILARACGWHDVRPEAVECRGIEEITPADLAEARQSRRTIRLVAELDSGYHGTRESGTRTGYLRVGPALLPREHPIASAAGPDNIFTIDALLAGPLLLKGAGAGARTTASAILGDCLRLLGRTARRRPPTVRRPDAPRTVYMRIADRSVDPDPVLASLARHNAEPSELAFTQHRISAIVRLSEPRAEEAARELAHPAGKPLVMPLLA